MALQYRAPYGDIFYVVTPSIDRISQQLYAEQRQRDLIRQRNQKALDDDFAKNVAGIRDADVPELTRLYSDWKLMNQRAMSKKGGVSPQEQLELLRKKGDMYKMINESKAGLQEEDEIRKDAIKNPDNYDDNYSTYLSTRRRLPISQLESYIGEDGKNINLRDYNTYRYKGTDTDFQKILNLAAGIPKQVYSKEEKLPGGLQFKITPYMYGNTPEQFKESLLSSLSERKAGRDAAALVSQIDPSVIDAVDKKFRQIPIETWVQMGLDKPQDLMVKNSDSKAEKFANHQAQLYALNNLPKEGTPLFRDDKAAIDARNFSQQKALEGLKQGYRKALIKYRKSGSGEAGQNILNEFINRQLSDPTAKDAEVTYQGSVYKGKQVKMPKFITDQYSINTGTKEQPNWEDPSWIVSEDKKYVIPIYTKKGDIRGGGWKGVTPDSKPILIEDYKAMLAKQWLSKSDAPTDIIEGFEGEEIEDTEQATPQTTQKNPTYKIKGKAYTEKQLLDMGYTLDDIKPYKN